MQLRDLAALLLRRWWLVLLPPAVALALSARSLPALLAPAPTYSTSVRFTVGQPPLDPATGYDPRYYSWLTSEYIAGGLKDWLRGHGYAQALSDDLARRHGLQIPADALQGAIAADSARSVLVLYLSWGNAGDLAAIADSGVHVLVEGNAAAFPQLGPQGAVLTPLDTVHIAANAPGLRDQLELPVRLALALLGGLALAFAVDYLDPALRTRREVEALGFPVLAEIPGRRPLVPFLLARSRRREN